MSLGQEIREGVASFLATRKQISDEQEQTARGKYYSALANKAENPNPKGGLTESEQGIFNQGRAASPFSLGAIPEPPSAAVTSAGNTLPKFAQASGEPGRFGVPDTLWAAQIHQESGGKQFGANGEPLTSARGATGVAQVMPDTAPEAARLAGLPFDETKYRSDAEYNDTLGRAYMGAQLKKFGDPAKALAAYNAGPHMVSKVVASYGDRWLNYLPDETRDYVARIMPQIGSPGGPVLGLALGGLVDDGSSDENATGERAFDPPQTVDDSNSAPPAAQNNPPDPLRDLADGIGGVLHAGLSFLEDHFGLKGNRAIPNSPEQASGGERFMRGEGAMSPQDVAAVRATVDPKGNLRQGLADAAGMKALYDHYVTRGDVGRARAMAGSMLQHFSNLSAQYGDEAAQLMRSGDMHGGLAKLEAGYEAVPDGRTLETTPNADGTYNLTQRDATGRVLERAKVPPQALMSFAYSLKDKGAYWRALIDAATNKYQTPSAQEDPAFNRYVGGLADREAQRGTLPVPNDVTYPGNALSGRARVLDRGQQGGMPASPAIRPLAEGPAISLPQHSTPAQSSPDQVRSQFVNSALGAFVKANPEPQLPARSELYQMTPENQRRVQQSYLSDHRNWMAQRNEVARTANAEFNDRIKTAQDGRRQAIPTPESRRQTADAIQGAVEQFEATLPEGTTLALADKRGINTAATHLFGANNISPNEAVEAALDLTDPRNPALDKAKGGVVPLRNGTSIMLDPQSFGALQTLRAKKLKDAEAKAAKDRKMREAGERMMHGAQLMLDNAALPRAARAYGELLPGMLDWAQQQWDEYQRSKPSRTVSLDDQ